MRTEVFIFVLLFAFGIGLTLRGEAQSATEATAEVTVHPEQPGRLVLVKVQAGANVTAYGVVSKNGTLHLVLLNKEGNTPIRVRISGARA